MAIRKNLSHPEKVRQRIRTSQLVNRLREHALGNVEMSQTQIRAAEILLKKSLPDLSSVEHSGQISHRHETEMSDAELARIAASSSAGATEAATGANEPPGVH